MLIINADDLGRTREATDNTLQCYQMGLVTSASVMVFMSDSERAAEMAVSAGMETGLHLNLDIPFDLSDIPLRLKQQHRQVVRYLRLSKWAQVVYNPSLRNSFRYAFDAQIEEYRRLFREDPTHIDGHHHMHLCLNMVLGRLIPPGMRVRRNFTFASGEKDPVNRFYRKLMDRWLLRRYICSDSFFSIEPIEDLPRLRAIVRLGRQENVELMTHPGKGDEYSFLQTPQFHGLINEAPRGTHRMLQAILP